MTRAMYDSVNAARLPADAKLVACYVDGHYANEAAVRARCPHATVVTITVLGHSDANVIDCEAGDATPDQAAAWAKAQIGKGKHPTIYCNLSTWPSVQQAVKAAGVPAGSVSYWVAHYDAKAEMIPGAVAKQYQERTDQNLDYSIAADYWPGVDPAPVAAEAVAPPRPTGPSTFTTLRRGSHGDVVAHLQRDLQRVYPGIAVGPQGHYTDVLAAAVARLRHDASKAPGDIGPGDFDANAARKIGWKV